VRLPRPIGAQRRLCVGGVETEAGMTETKRYCDGCKNRIDDHDEYLSVTVKVVTASPQEETKDFCIHCSSFSDYAQSLVIAMRQRQKT
jgi:predicted naringenin-chalcone synthase